MKNAQVRGNWRATSSSLLSLANQQVNQHLNLLWDLVNCQQLRSELQSTEISLINQIYSFRHIVKGVHKFYSKELEIDFKAIFKVILYNHM